MITESSGAAHPGSPYVGPGHAGRGHGGRGRASEGYAGTAHVYEWQFYILDGEQAGYPWRENNNGLVAVSSGLAVFCGTDAGQVAVTADLCEAPPLVDYDEWDEIVEVSYYTARGDTRVCSWPGKPVAGIPVISRYGAGMYRIRAHARGRDVARGGLRRMADEFHFAIWPAPGAPTGIHKTTDQVGRVLRAGFASGYPYR